MEVAAVSQSGGRAFVASINLNADNNYCVTMHARKKTGETNR